MDHEPSGTLLAFLQLLSSPYASSTQVLVSLHLRQELLFALSADEEV